MDFDLETIQNAIKLATDGSKAASSVADVMTRFKKLFDTPKALSQEDLRPLVIELTENVLNAKTANLELKEQLLAMREAALERQARKEQFSRYALWQTGTGSLVYRLKEECEDKEPLHYLCPPCKEEGHASILQGPHHYKECPRCKAGYKFEELQPLPRIRGNRTDFEV